MNGFFGNRFQVILKKLFEKRANLTKDSKKFELNVHMNLKLWKISLASYNSEKIVYRNLRKCFSQNFSAKTWTHNWMLRDRYNWFLFLFKFNFLLPLFNTSLYVIKLNFYATMSYHKISNSLGFKKRREIFWNTCLNYVSKIVYASSINIYDVYFCNCDYYSRL